MQRYLAFNLRAVLRHSCNMGPGFRRVWEGGMPQKSGGSNRAAAVKSVDSISMTLDFAAVVMPSVKCLVSRSGVITWEGSAEGDVPSISVMKAVVRGVVRLECDRREMKLSSHCLLGEVEVLTSDMVGEAESNALLRFCAYAPRKTNPYVEGTFVA